MATLICNHFPFLQIYNPANGEYIRFQAGRLDIEPGDPNYDVVMAEATRNPAIAVVESATTCTICGEVFTGKMAKARLGKHRKEHTAEYDAEQAAEAEAVRMIEVKAREGFACDVCRPIQAFPSEDELAAHNLVFHMAAPEMDDEGNEVGRQAE